MTSECGHESRSHPHCHQVDVIHLLARVTARAAQALGRGTGPRALGGLRIDARQRLLQVADHRAAHGVDLAGVVQLRTALGGCRLKAQLAQSLGVDLQGAIRSTT